MKTIQISNDPNTGLKRQVKWLAHHFWDDRIKEVQSFWEVLHFDQNDNYLFSRQVNSHLDNSTKVDKKGMRLNQPVLSENPSDEDKVKYEQDLENYNNALGQYDFWANLLETEQKHSDILAYAILELDKIGYWNN